VRTQAERSAATRARLIEATIESLSRLGYSATSTVLVADSARVSRGAMLHQFASKAVLIGAVFEHIYADAIARYRAALDPIVDPVERLEVLVDTAWAHFRSPAGIAQTEILMATRSDPDIAAVISPLHAQTLERSRGRHAGHFAAAGLPEELSDAFLYHSVGLLRGLALEYALGTPLAHLQPAVDLMKAMARRAYAEGALAEIAR
jgi:AcrR family transcriptional regulator